MPASRPPLFPTLLLLLSSLAVPVPVPAQPRMTTVVASDPASLRTWDASVDRMLRSGDLEVRRTDTDTLVSGRTHTRLRQLHRGVPVCGAEITRQTDSVGATVSIFGTEYSGIDIDVTPSISTEDAAGVVLAVSGVELGGAKRPTLCVFPASDGFRLAYRATAFRPDGATAYVIDAHDGSILQQSDALERQSAVGVGTGVLGDQKKMSVTADSGGFNARDPLRPPLLTTYDLHGDLQHALDFLNGRITLGVSDRRRCPHELGNSQPGLLPRDRRRHESHVRPRCPGSRPGEPRSDRKSDVSRVHPVGMIARTAGLLPPYRSVAA